MTHFLRLSFLLPCLLLIASPARSADGMMLASSYFPLAVGTTWHYRIGEARFKVKVTKHEKVGNTLAARLEMFADGKEKPNAVQHYAITGDAVVRISDNGKQITPPLVLLKLPPTKGQSWKIDSKVDDQTIKGVFKAGEEKVDVPAGKYPVTVTVTGQDLDVNGTKMSLTYYFAEKVGMVRQVIEVSGQKIDAKLEKFEPGK